MPYKQNDDRRHKFDKAKYKVTNWSEYNDSLKNRFNITIWFSDEAIESWHPEIKNKKRGAQPTYSDIAIETVLTVRSVFKFPLRGTQGFLESIASIMGLEITIPNYSTLSRRAKNLEVIKYVIKSNEPINMIVDSTGLKICGSGEWQETKHGLQKRKSWRKLHLAIDEKTGNIVASELTTHKKDDPSQMPVIVGQVDNDIESISADGAYDRKEVYDVLDTHESGPIKSIIPPRKDARLSDNALISPTQRDRHIVAIEEKGRMKWQKDTGYNKRSLVETAMFRYKVLIGGFLRSSKFKNQITEAKIGIAILNKMTDLGMPKTVRA